MPYCLREIFDAIAVALPVPPRNAKPMQTAEQCEQPDLEEMSGTSSQSMVACTVETEESDFEEIMDKIEPEENASEEILNVPEDLDEFVPENYRTRIQEKNSQTYASKKDMIIFSLPESERVKVHYIAQHGVQDDDQKATLSLTDKKNGNTGCEILATPCAESEAAISGVLEQTKVESGQQICEDKILQSGCYAIPSETATADSSIDGGRQVSGEVGPSESDIQKEADDSTKSPRMENDIINPDSSDEVGHLNCKKHRKEGISLESVTRNCGSENQEEYTQTHTHFTNEKTFSSLVECETPNCLNEHNEDLRTEKTSVQCLEYDQNAVSLEEIESKTLNCANNGLKNDSQPRGNIEETVIVAGAPHSQEMFPESTGPTCDNQPKQKESETMSDVEEYPKENYCVVMPPENMICQLTEEGDTSLSLGMVLTESGLPTQNNSHENQGYEVPSRMVTAQYTYIEKIKSSDCEVANASNPTELLSELTATDGCHADGSFCSGHSMEPVCPDQSTEAVVQQTCIESHLSNDSTRPPEIAEVTMLSTAAPVFALLNQQNATHTYPPNVPRMSPKLMQMSGYQTVNVLTSPMMAATVASQVIPHAGVLPGVKGMWPRVSQDCLSSNVIYTRCGLPRSQLHPIGSNFSPARVQMLPASSIPISPCGPVHLTTPMSVRLQALPTASNISYCSVQRCSSLPIISQQSQFCPPLQFTQGIYAPRLSASSFIPHHLQGIPTLRHPAAPNFNAQAYRTNPLQVLLARMVQSSPETYTDTAHLRPHMYNRRGRQNLTPYQQNASHYNGHFNGGNAMRLNAIHHSVSSSHAAPPEVQQGSTTTEENNQEASTSKHTEDEQKLCKKYIPKPQLNDEGLRENGVVKSTVRRTKACMERRKRYKQRRRHRLLEQQLAAKAEGLKDAAETVVTCKQDLENGNENDKQ